MAKDKSYKVGIAGKWLKDHELVDDLKDASTFESLTEPTQRINQLKKDKKIKTNSKITVKELTESTLFKEALREADKTRFLKPAYARYIELCDGEKPEDVPELEDLVDWVNSGAADKYHFDWNRIKQLQTTEIMRVFNCYNKYYEEGGSRKEKKKNRTSFADKDLFQILQIENENWLFVCPRNWKACIYMDSFECGGQGAQWCIGWEKEDTYWYKYITGGSRFVLALRKHNAPKSICVRDYDSRPGMPAEKYMIELLPTGEARGWRPSDQPDNTLDNQECEEIFGLPMSELFEKTNNWSEIVNDVEGSCLSLDSILKGTAEFTDGRSIEIQLPDEVDTIDVEKLFQFYGEKDLTLAFRGGNIKTVLVGDDGRKKLAVTFKNCLIDEAYFAPVRSDVLFYGCNIGKAKFLNVYEVAEQESASDEEGGSIEDWLDTAYYLLYDNEGNLDFTQTTILRKIYY